MYELRFDTHLAEIKNGWFICPVQGERFIGGLPVLRHAPLGTMMMVGGVAMDTYGQYAQGQAMKAQANTERRILEYNASIKDREAKLALERARADARMFQEEGEAFQASQNVAIAKGGVLATTGTPRMVIEQTAENLGADRRMILKEGFLAQSALQQQAEGLRYEARAAQARGKNIGRAFTIRAGQSLLTGLHRLGAYDGISGSKMANLERIANASGPVPEGVVSKALYG